LVGLDLLRRVPGLRHDPDHLPDRGRALEELLEQVERVRLERVREPVEEDADGVRALALRLPVREQALVELERPAVVVRLRGCRRGAERLLRVVRRHCWQRPARRRGLARARGRGAAYETGGGAREAEHEAETGEPDVRPPEQPGVETILHETLLGSTWARSDSRIASERNFVPPCAVWPPSTTISAPLTNEDSSETR